jgi:hypothetical protein
VPIEWTEADDLAALPPSEIGGGEDAAGLSVRH